MTSNPSRQVLRSLSKRLECPPRSRRLSSEAVELNKRRQWLRPNPGYRPSSSSSSISTSSLPLAAAAARGPLQTHRWYSSSDIINQNDAPGNSTTTMEKLNFSIFDMNAAAGIDEADVQTAEDLEVLVNQLEEMESLTYADMQPIIRPLIRACERIRDKERSADLAERILFNCLARLPSDIAERFDEHKKDASDPTTLLPYPDQAIYTKVMTILGSLRSEDAANRVNRLFRLMTAEHRAELVYMAQAGKKPDEYSIRAAEPNASTFKSLLRAWCIAGTAFASKEAENVLVEMEELSGMRDGPGMPPPDTALSFSLAPPDVECYNMVLISYSRVDNRRHPLVFDRARALFGRMQQLEQQGDFKLQWFSYHALLKCVQSHLRVTQKKIDDEFIDQLERMIPELCSVPIPHSFLKRFKDQGVHPRAWAFGVLIDTILHETKDESRIRKADFLIRQMVGEIPSEGAPLSQLWPSQATLATMAKAWRCSKLPGTEDGLERIRSLATQSSFLTTHHVHVAMQAWEESRLPDAPPIVEAFLDRMLNPSSQLLATGESFAFVMRTWMRSAEAERANKVERLLFRMHDLYRERKSNRYMANETHLNHVLQAWQFLCRDGKRYPGIHGLLYPAQHARSHLDYMQGSNVWDPRNYSHYSTVLGAWAKQVVEANDHDTFPAREAAALLADMEKRSGECPPAPHCNMVLQACLRDKLLDSQKREAYEIAMETFNKGSRDPFSYILAVEIVKRSVGQLQDDHLHFIESIVRTCRDSGELTQALVYEAVEVLDKDALKRLFHFTDSYADMILENRSNQLVRKDGKKLRWMGRSNLHGLKVANLPRSWSQNTERRRMRRDVIKANN